jgi:hypothetical protein
VHSDRSRVIALAAALIDREWFANIGSKRTQRAYQLDLRDCMRFFALVRAMGFAS